jgi:ABC-type nitrate/sulfonate/bicarbonate transport system substrate-binding protein
MAPPGQRTRFLRSSRVKASRTKIIGLLQSRLFQVSALAAVCVMLLAIAYQGSRGQSLKRDVAVEKLTIALPVLPHGALLHIADAQGFFAEEGLDVTLLPANHGVAALGHVLQGAANLAVTGEVPFVIAVTRGDALGMVASIASVSNQNTIVARRDRAIARIGDLAGKKIGVSFGTGSSYYLWVFLIRHKLPFDALELVDVPPERIVRALTDGSVDAVATWPPISTQAQAALGRNALSFTERSTHSNAMVVVGRSEFLKGHAPALAKLLRALLRAEQFMLSRPEDTLNLVSAWLKTDPAALRSTWKQFDFNVNLLQSHLITLEDEARWAMARGYAAKGPAPNFLPHLYLDALLAVQPERVTVIR